METIYLRNKALSPLLKWPGGKTNDLKCLRENFIELFPKKINDYYEPFLGGGAFWLTIQPSIKMYVNDFSSDLIKFYTCIKTQNQKFFDYINKMSDVWQTLHNIAIKHFNELYDGNLSFLMRYKEAIISIKTNEDAFEIIKKTFISKLSHIKKMENKTNKLSNEDRLTNIEGALKAGYYTYIRNIYNNKCHNTLRYAVFYFLRDYAFSSMFRFNKDGHFNVPYGGISYNNRLPNVRLNYWKSSDLLKHLNNTEFDNLDFEEFLNKRNPKKDDFLFIDPPYDSKFNTYDQNKFSHVDQERLAKYLYKTEAQFMAVMKNTDFISNLYVKHKNQNIQWQTFDKNYTVSFRNRNDKNVEHIVIYRIND